MDYSFPHCLVKKKSCGDRSVLKSHDNQEDLYLVRRQQTTNSDFKLYVYGMTGEGHYFENVNDS